MATGFRQRSRGAWRAGAARASVVTLVLALWTAAAAAQTTDRSGIEGKVTDSSGGTLPGVTVTISSPALQAPQLTTVTGGDGEYRFTRLPAGLYNISYELSGFQTIRREGVRLGVGFTATIDVSLPVGSVEETLTVVGESPLVDVRSTTTQTNISKELIEALPTSRSYYEVLNLASGIRSNTIDVGGSATGGGRTGGTSYGTLSGGYAPMLDGVNTMATAGYFDVGALEEVIVRTGGSDAEVAVPGYTFLGVVKSGGNDFHGGGLLQWQTPRLQSNNLDDFLRSQGARSGNEMDRYYDANGDIGGRFIRDRLWFYTSARQQELRARVLGYSIDPGPDGRYGTGDDVPGFATDTLSNLTGKVTGQLTTKQRVSWMHHYDFKEQHERAGSAFRPREATGYYVLPNHVYKWEWTYTPSNNGIVNAMVGRSYWKSREVPYNDLPSSFDYVTQMWGGAKVNSVGIDSTPSGSVSSRWQYQANYTYFKSEWLGTHEFKAGVETNLEYYNKFQELRGPGTGGAGQDYLLYFFAGEPAEVLLRNSPFNSRNNVDRQFVYAKDNWRVNDRLTLNLGLRFERHYGYLPAQSKPPGPFSSAADFPHKDIYDWRAVAPRTGVAYALTSDHRSVVKASYGRFGFFVGANEGGGILRPYNENDYVAWRHAWVDVNGNRNFDVGLGELGRLIATEGGTNSVPSPVRQPKVDEVTAYFERQVLSNLSAKVGYVYKQLSDQYQQVNLLRPHSAFTIPITARDPGPDGVVGTADDGGMVTYYDYDPAFRGEQFTWTNTPGYTDSYHNVELEVNKRLADNWQLVASYLATKSDAWINGVPQTPNEDQFPKNQTWEQTFKVMGTYKTFWDIYAGARYEHLSGAPLARDALFRTGLRQLSTVVVRMEPLGARRLPALNLLSLRAAKQFELRGNRLELQFDVHNALNANTARAMTVRSGPNFGRITSILPPRIARVGMSYKF
jgi:hypothetical protein